MLPLKYAVEDAPTEDEIVRRLSALLDYVRACRVASILPQRYAGLTARNTVEIRAWAFKLAAGDNESHCLSAAGRCWLGELHDAFNAAARRLDELSAARVHRDAA
jgi:hypothetical protein